MDGQYSWKRTEDMEIDLTDLLRKLCGQWKRMLVSMLVCGMVFAGFWIWKEGAGMKEAVPALEDMEELSKEEMQGVRNAAGLAGEIRLMEEYLDESILMQTDPYHKNRIVLLYSIEQAKRQNLQKIIESYLNYLINGGAVEDQKESGSMKVNLDSWQISELISAYQKTYSSPFQIVTDDKSDSSFLAEAVFYVEITGKDDKMAEQLADDIKAVLKQYSMLVKDAAGSHSLTLVSGEKNVVADTSLRSWQHEQKTVLASYRENLKNMVSAFSKGQMSASQKEPVLKDVMGEEMDEESAEAGRKLYSAAARYLLFGMAAGVFAYCGIFSCWYLWKDTVKSVEEMKRMYFLPFYGSLSITTSNAEHLPAAGKDALCKEAAGVLNRIRFVCKKRGIERIVIVSDFDLDGREKECLDELAAKLQDYGIGAVIADNINRDTVFWDSAADAGSLLMVCRIGTTTHRMIDDAMGFYTENGMDVMGTVVFCSPRTKVYKRKSGKEKRA